jgi:hypothetical protein
MRLDRPERASRLARDLVEAQLAEEAQGDDLAIRLIESAHGGSKTGRTLGTKRRDLRVGTTREVDAGRGVGRVDPRHVAPALGPSQGDPDRDPDEPRREWTVAAPPGEAAECDHEGLLGRILGLVEVAEDSVTRPDDRGRFTLDEDPECVPVPRQDGLDGGALVEDAGADDGNGR